MDDKAYRFFTQPTQTYHRRYEALRAVFVERRPQIEVAEQFGYTHGTMRQMVLEFRRRCDANEVASESPFFEATTADEPIRKRKRRRIRP